MFQVGDIEYALEDIESMVYDSVVDGYCRVCKEVTCGAEPDAVANWCPACEKNKVVSVLVYLGIC